MGYRHYKSMLLILLVTSLNFDLCAQNNNQNSDRVYDVSIISKGLGSILCNEQYKIGNDERKEFTLRNNADVRLRLSPNKGSKLLKFTINGINRLQDLNNNQITLKNISQKTIVVATFENTALTASPPTNQNNRVENSYVQPTRVSPPKNIELNLQQIVLGLQQYTLKDFATKDIKSNFGGFVSYGNTYLLNSSPSTLNLGLDIVFAEAGYNNYQLKYRNKTDSYHQIELGAQAGLSLVLVFGDTSYGKLYARYAPRYSMLYANEKWYKSYGNYIVGGSSFHISRFGLGGELCYGSCYYLKEDNEDAPKNSNIGLRFFVSYNF